MALSRPAPEIDKLFIAQEELAEASGVVAADPLLPERGQRGKSAIVATATGLASGLVTALAFAPALRLPAGLAVAALVICLIAALAEVGEVVVVAAVAAMAALAWFGLRVVDVSAAALASTLAAALVAGAATFVASRQLRAYKRRRIGYDVLTRLTAAVARFNALVRAVDVKERLARARGDEGIAPRPAVLDALATTRENLLRAVRVQRILRENRDVVAGVQALRVDDLLPLEALRIEADADAYADVVGETAELAAEVQQAYDELRQDARR
jgi:hypothetical protein